MQSWKYNLDDVLLASYKGLEQPVQVAGYVDGLDDSKPLLCHVRVSDGQRWGERTVKITKEQIIKTLPDWYTEQHKKWEAGIKETASRVIARMSPAQKERMLQEMGMQDTRSPLDILIDRAVGREL